MMKFNRFQRAGGVAARGGHARVRRFVRMLLVLLLLTAALGGCLTFLRSFTAPVVTLYDVRLVALNLGGGEIDVVLGVYNPNGYKLDATRLTYVVHVDSTEVGRGAVDTKLQVHARDSTRVSLPVQFTFAGIGAVARQIQSTAGVDYVITGDVQLQTPIGRMTHPFSSKGRFSLFSNTPNQELGLSLDR